MATSEVSSRQKPPSAKRIHRDKGELKSSRHDTQLSFATSAVEVHI